MMAQAGAVRARARVVEARSELNQGSDRGTVAGARNSELGCRQWYLHGQSAAAELDSSRASLGARGTAAAGLGLRARLGGGKCEVAFWQTPSPVYIEPTWAAEGSLGAVLRV